MGTIEGNMVFIIGIESERDQRPIHTGVNKYFEDTEVMSCQRQCLVVVSATVICPKKV